MGLYGIWLDIRSAEKALGEAVVQGLFDEDSELETARRIIRDLDELLRLLRPADANQIHQDS